MYDKNLRLVWNVPDHRFLNYAYFLNFQFFKVQFLGSFSETRIDSLDLEVGHLADLRVVKLFELRHCGNGGGRRFVFLSSPYLLIH